MQLPDLPDVSENLPLGLQVARGFQSAHTDDANVTQRGLQSDMSNQSKSQDTPSNHQNNEQSMNRHTTVAEEIGKMTETAPNNIQGTDIDKNTPTNRNQDTDDGLQVETSDIENNSNKGKLNAKTGNDIQGGLNVETYDDKKDSANKKNDGLPVETPEAANINLEHPHARNEYILPVETKTKNNPDHHNEQITEAAVGLILLGQEGNDPLFDRYDNSKLLPIGTVPQPDPDRDPNTEDNVLTIEDAKQQTGGVITMDNNNDNYDSDNTVLLEQEITDVIGEGPIPGDGLPVEMTNRDETQEITDQLSDLSVNIQQRAATIAKTDDLPVETTDPPISPNKGKVVICSYKLRWTIPTTTESV